MNAVLVVTKNPKFLERATQWVQRLDRSDTSGTTVRVYRLKYGSAPQVAKILNEIFVAQRSGSSIGDTPASQTAPGMSTAQSRLDSLTTANAGSSGARRQRQRDGAKRCSARRSLNSRRRPDRGRVRKL